MLQWFSKSSMAFFVLVLCAVITYSARVLCCVAVLCCIRRFLRYTDLFLKISFSAFSHEELFIFLHGNSASPYSALL